MEYDKDLDDAIINELYFKNSNLKRGYNELYSLVNDNYFKKKKCNINKDLSRSTFNFHLHKLLSENVLEKHDSGMKGSKIPYFLSKKTIIEIKYKIFEIKSKREQQKIKESDAERHKKLYLLLLFASFPEDSRFLPSKKLTETEFNNFLNKLNMQEENLQIVNKIIYDSNNFLTPTEGEWNDYGNYPYPTLFSESLVHLYQRRSLWKILENKIKNKEITKDKIYMLYRKITFESFDRFQIEKRFYQLSKEISPTPFYYIEYTIYNKGFILEDLINQKRRIFYESIGFTADEIKETIKIGLEEKIIIPSNFIDSRYIIFDKELEKYLERCTNFVYAILDIIITLSKYFKPSEEERKYLELFKGKVYSNKILNENYELRQKRNPENVEPILNIAIYELDNWIFQNYLDLTVPSINNDLVNKYNIPLDIILEAIYPKLIQNSIKKKIRNVMNKNKLEIQNYNTNKKR